MPRALGMVKVTFSQQQYLPDGLEGHEFYHPSDQGYEAQIAERLKKWREKPSL